MIRASLARYLDRATLGQMARAYNTARRDRLDSPNAGDEADAHARGMAGVAEWSAEREGDRQLDRVADLAALVEEAALVLDAHELGSAAAHLRGRLREQVASTSAGPLGRALRGLAAKARRVLGAGLASEGIRLNPRS